MLPTFTRSWSFSFNVPVFYAAVTDGDGHFVRVGTWRFRPENALADAQAWVAKAADRDQQGGRS